MRLEPLFDATWTDTHVRAIQPSSAGDGYLYGQGTGVLTGRVSGRAERSNFPRRHQGYTFPEAHGGFAAGEGTIDAAVGVLVMRYYACELDYLPVQGEPSESPA